MIMRRCPVAKEPRDEPSVDPRISEAVPRHHDAVRLVEAMEEVMVNVGQVSIEHVILDLVMPPDLDGQAVQEATAIHQTIHCLRVGHYNDLPVPPVVRVPAPGPVRPRRAT